MNPLQIKRFYIICLLSVYRVTTFKNNSWQDFDFRFSKSFWTMILILVWKSIKLSCTIYIFLKITEGITDNVMLMNIMVLMIEKCTIYYQVNRQRFFSYYRYSQTPWDFIWDLSEILKTISRPYKKSQSCIQTAFEIPRERSHLTSFFLLFKKINSLILNFFMKFFLSKAGVTSNGVSWWSTCNVIFCILIVIEYLPIVKLFE